MNWPDNAIEVYMPTSPTPIHPSIDHIKETIESVRYHLPQATIRLLIDGVREEQQDRYDDYQEYIRRLLTWANHQQSNILPTVFPSHTHQASMTRHAIDHSINELLLFVEHDTPLTLDPIDWDGCCNAILGGHANVIRFHHETHILQPHEHLMLDRESIPLYGRALDAEPTLGYRTAQWSQRPHLASKVFYSNMIRDYFHPDSRTMIEDVVHGRLHSAWADHGTEGWDEWKVWIYAPISTDHIKRSTHLDSRGDDIKYPMVIA